MTSGPRYSMHRIGGRCEAKTKPPGDRRMAVYTWRQKSELG
jgi:hypothetical protein